LYYIIIIIIFLTPVFSGCKKPPEDNSSLKKETLTINSGRKDSLKNNIFVDIPEGIITKLPTKENVIALTFDACETKSPAYFDEGILSYLIKEKIPFTVFVSGKFGLRNKERLKELSKLDFIEIENHSFNHFQHMENLTSGQVEKEVTENENLIFEITGKRTGLFRFPGGNYNKQNIETVENLGYRVVHWRIPASDPDRHVTKGRLVKWVLYNAQPGDILIFHINGKGYKTAEALPEITDSLKKRGYRFVKPEEYIK